MRNSLITILILILSSLCVSVLNLLFSDSEMKYGLIIYLILIVFLFLYSRLFIEKRYRHQVLFIGLIILFTGFNITYGMYISDLNQIQYYAGYPRNENIIYGLLGYSSLFFVVFLAEKKMKTRFALYIVGLIYSINVLFTLILIFATIFVSPHG